MFVAFKERMFSLPLGQKATSQKQLRVHCNPCVPAQTHVPWRAQGMQGSRRPGLSWSTTSLFSALPVSEPVLAAEDAEKKRHPPELSHG